MKLTQLAKDLGSGASGCPTVYLGENGDLVIQGNELDTETFENLSNVLPGESAVRISADVVLAAIEQYKARHSS